jgi:transposase InsO family protein
MPWKETCAMSLREEFVRLASQEQANVRALCRRFEVSAKTAYKWLGRFREGGAAALGDRSRKPRASPVQTSATIERLVLDARDRHPAWGGRKLRQWLLNRGVKETPAASTITQILKRHGRIDAADSAKHTAFTRFEHAAPNDLWQMDFKGHFALEDRSRCHPLTVLDDHSRYNLGLRACGCEQGILVQQELTTMFRRYGLPRRMLMDNGPPWGDDPEHPYTPLTVWLLRLGIGISHGRPYHPQTQGKEERFHRTFKAEVIARGRFRNLADCQPQFDPWREIYNHERPHEALAMGVPSSRYRVSERAFPEALPSLEYAPDCQVRKVQQGGKLGFRGRTFRVGKAFLGYPLGLRATTTDGCWEVRFGWQVIGQFDLREPGNALQRPRRGEAETT